MSGAAEGRVPEYGPQNDMPKQLRADEGQMSKTVTDAPVRAFSTVRGQPSWQVQLTVGTVRRANAGAPRRGSRECGDCLRAAVRDQHPRENPRRGVVTQRPVDEVQSAGIALLETHRPTSVSRHIKRRSPVPEPRWALHGRWAQRWAYSWAQLLWSWAQQLRGRSGRSGERCPSMHGREQRRQQPLLAPSYPCLEVVMSARAFACQSCVPKVSC